MAPVLGWLGGHWLDGRFHTAPWIAMAGLLLGIVAGFRELVRLSMRAMRENPVNPNQPSAASTLKEGEKPAARGDRGDQ